MQIKTSRLSLLLLATTIPAVAAEFYVAPNGNDSNPGSKAQPFATLQGAQEAVRSARKVSPEEGVTVFLKQGVYSLTETLQFTPEDSGASADRPVRYVAEAGREVVISGGRKITGWQPDPAHPGVWKARVESAQVGGDQASRFEQLWVEGRRAIRARSPDYWAFAALTGVAEEPAPGNGSTVRHAFNARPSSTAVLRNLDETAMRDVQVVVFHKWDTTREWLESASPAQGQFVTSGSKMQSWNRMERDCLFYFENCLSALDRPGEWFLDRQGWVYYWPRPGENLKRAEVIAPHLERFLAFKGEAAHPGRWVQHIRFEGLKFCYGEFRVPPAGLPPAQAAMNAEATAIQLDAARDIRFTGCAVEHIGSTAFWFRHACRDCRVERTRMFDLGIGGIRIGEPSIVPEPVRTGAITVDNCILQSGGRLMPHTVAVWIGHSADNTISHCDIGDWFYTAVSVGWRWGYDESAAKRNRIEFNHLHHLGYRILSDMGGVYTLGPSEGTVVQNNVIHDVYSTRYGGWGLYPDEGSTGILFANNLVYDVRDGCVHQHYGKENIFRNNILAFSEEGQVAVTRSEPHLSFTFERNIVYWDDGRLLGYGGWKSGAKVILENNLYWRAAGKPFDFEGATWEQWRAKGNDAGSLVADPLFADPAHRDFRLRPGSPAHKIGFEPFDYSLAGVHGDASWKRVAASTTYPKPYVVPEPEPLQVRDDFELGSVTPLLALATIADEGQGGLIAVTDSFAAGGHHSLKIQDRPGLKFGFDPHFYLDPHHTKGIARLAFKIRLDPASDVSCEWRDQANPYRTGPSIRFQNGAISTRGRRLVSVPSDQWLSVEMRSPLGKPGSRWTLKIILADGTTKFYDDLPADPNWAQTRWLGFSSNADNSSAFYLDDFSLEMTD